MNHIFREPELHDVQRILDLNDLPTDDLSELNLGHFFGCGEKSSPKGIIGLEVLGTDGLVRSFAVDLDARDQGCGSSLFHQLEEHSKSIGIDTLYLLTETAEKYFERKGFEPIARELASDPVKQTREFSSLCPDSATLMRKTLKN